MKNKILTMLHQLGDGVSFADLSRIDGFAGKLMYGNAEKNIYFWTSCSQKAIDALNALIEEKKIVLKPTTEIVYLNDGLIPKLPIARQSRKYASERWLPVVLNRSDKTI
jgi:hypothetical protein